MNTIKTPIILPFETISYLMVFHYFIIVFIFLLLLYICLSIQNWRHNLQVIFKSDFFIY